MFFLHKPAKRVLKVGVTNVRALKATAVFTGAATAPNLAEERTGQSEASQITLTSINSVDFLEELDSKAQYHRLQLLTYAKGAQI